MQSAVREVDLLVIGGGINGVGIARDAAGRGLSVMLCEKDDLASHTSSSSTKLIHGGLRYLEYYEFALVRKALQEREVLLRSAPHIIWPLRFVMPHVPALRPAWLIRLGLFLYDHLSKRAVLPGSTSVDLRRSPAGMPLRETLHKGFIYSDAWVDDARLVVLNALAAAENGAIIRTRTRVDGARRIGHDGATARWEVALCTQSRDACGEQHSTVHARAIANAAGPWVGALQGHMATGKPAKHQVRLVKGSHIVTRKLFDHDHAYIFQNPDKRIIFAIPYEREFTLIGTTDEEYRGDSQQVAISAAEIDYLCDSVNRYFKRAISADDVVWTYSGVRPLLDEDSNNPSAVTRDYRLELDAAAHQAPLLSVFGGKITTFRKLAEQAVDKLSASLSIEQRSQTETAVLPGGDMKNADFNAYLAAFSKRYPWLDAALAHRLCRAYGTRAERILSDACTFADLGDQVAPGLYVAELRYLRDNEWARSADDVLWRRSKLGLHLPADASVRIDEWFSQQTSDLTKSTLM